MECESRHLKFFSGEFDSCDKIEGDDHPIPCFLVPCHNRHCVSHVLQEVRRRRDGPFGFIVDYRSNTSIGIQILEVDLLQLQEGSRISLKSAAKAQDASTSSLKIPLIAESTSSWSGCALLYFATSRQLISMIFVAVS